MRARSFFAPLLVGIALLTLVVTVCPPSTRGASIGFAAGGNTQAGAIYGVPTGTNPAVANNGTSTLGIGIPFQSQISAEYMYAGSCPWIQPALTAEGYSFGNGANQWRIVYTTLNANDISLNILRPWVNTRPAVPAQGAFPALPQANLQGVGGAQISLSYAANGRGDPQGTNATYTQANPNTYLNWIQVVATNAPSPFGTGNGHGVAVGGGLTAYVDNGYLSNAGNNRNGPVPNNPFYGGLNSGSAYGGTGTYLSNATTLVDRVPARDLPTAANTVVDWQAQAFLANWSPNVAPGNTNLANAANVIAGGGTITIYDGVWWGFELSSVPEPSSFVMLISGSLGVLVAGYYRTLRGGRKQASTSSSLCAG